MPSKSKSQQRFFGMVDAYQKGKLKDASKKIKDAAKSMTKKEVHDFAATKHKGLPEEVKENSITLSGSDFEKLIKESVHNILTELDWRTYANAAKKRDAQIQQFGRNAIDKGGNRLATLRNNADYAASDALTAKYAQRGNNGHPTNNADVYTKNGYQTVTTNNFTKDGRHSKGEFNYDNKGGVNKQGHNIPSQMDDEVENYLNGNSQYIKGNGWKSNVAESVINEAIRETIKRITEEMND